MNSVVVQNLRRCMSITLRSVMITGIQGVEFGFSGCVAGLKEKIYQTPSSLFYIADSGNNC